MSYLTCWLYNCKAAVTSITLILSVRGGHHFLPTDRCYGLIARMFRKEPFITKKEKLSQALQSSWQRQHFRARLESVISNI